MPLDPRIILGVQNPQIQSPLEVMTSVAQLQQVREQAEARRLAAEEARERRTEAQEEKARQKQLEEHYAAAVKIDPETGQITLDRPTLLQNAQPHELPVFLKALQDEEDRMNEVLKRNLESEKSRREFLGAEGIDIEGELGNPEAWPLRLRRLRDIKAIDEPTYQEYLKVTDAPNILAIAQGWARRAAGQGKLVPVKTVNAQGQEVTRFVREQEGVEYRAAPKDVNLQAKDVLLDGQPALATFNPDTGKYHIGGQDVTARVRPIPPPSPLQLVSVLDPSGKPILVPESQAIGKTPGSAAAQAPPVDARAITEASVGLVDRLAKHPGMGVATGAYEWRGWTQEAVDFNAIRDQLVAALTLPNLGALKGPMSDKDILFVKNLATRLENRKLSEAETRRALTEARTFLQDKLKAGGAGAADAARVRVVGPNGQTGTVPTGTTLPPGWRKE